MFVVGSSISPALEDYQKRVSTISSAPYNGMFIYKLQLVVGRKRWGQLWEALYCCSTTPIHRLLPTLLKLSRNSPEVRSIGSTFVYSRPPPFRLSPAWATHGGSKRSPAHLERRTEGRGAHVGHWKGKIFFPGGIKKPVEWWKKVRWKTSGLC